MRSGQIDILFKAALHHGFERMSLIQSILINSFMIPSVIASKSLGKCTMYDSIISSRKQTELQL